MVSIISMQQCWWWVMILTVRLSVHPISSREFSKGSDALELVPSKSVSLFVYLSGCLIWTLVCCLSSGWHFRQSTQVNNSSLTLFCLHKPCKLHKRVSTRASGSMGPSHTDATTTLGNFCQLFLPALESSDRVIPCQINK